MKAYDFRALPLLADIMEDKELTTKQRDFLLHFFTEGPTLFDPSAAAEAARCSYQMSYEWRTSDQFPHFMKYYSKYVDAQLTAANKGMWKLNNHDGDPRYAGVNKFVLERLSKDWKEKLDITSGDQPVSGIVFTILKKSKETDEGTQEDS